MSDDKRDILEVLKFELNFLEQGGYGRSVRTPWKPTSAFQDSLTCLNFNDPERSHPCSECFLSDMVPDHLKSEDVPCHHIALNPEGEKRLQHITDMFTGDKATASVISLKPKSSSL